MWTASESGRETHRVHALAKPPGGADAKAPDSQVGSGDDIRFIDWNVTARMNEAYVKLFSEEREMTVLLVVDMSASGRFGSRQREKRDRGQTDDRCAVLSPRHECASQ